LGVQLKRIRNWAEAVQTRGYVARHKLATAGVGMLLLVMGYHVLFGINGVVAYQQKRRESRELQQQIDNLKRQNEQVEQQIKALKYDPQAIEKEARERLRYARPGEVVYTIPAARPAAPPPASKK
jgi:cell division protein FtsB